MQMETTFDSNAGVINFTVFDSAGSGRAGITVTSDAGGVVGNFKADHSRLDPTLTVTEAVPVQAGNLTIARVSCP